HHECGSSRIRSHAERHHRCASASKADLLRDVGVRPLRPRAADHGKGPIGHDAFHMGTDRSRRPAGAGGSLTAITRMIEVVVSRLGMDPASQAYVVVLQEKGGERLLPIWIGR